MKIVTISKFKGYGKTSLVEKLVGKKLEWNVTEHDDYLNISTASCECNDKVIEFTEIDTLLDQNKEKWHIVEQKIVEADVILYVLPKPVKPTMDTIDIFFFDFEDRYGEAFKAKRFIVQTFCFIKPDVVQWYESMTEEDRVKFEKEWAEENGAGNISFIDGWQNDFDLCTSLWLGMNMNDKLDIYETDTESGCGYDKLWQRINEFAD